DVTKISKQIVNSLCEPYTHQVVFSRITASIFVEFLIDHKRHPDGSYHSKSHYGGFRSALKHYFAEAKIRQSADLVDELEEFFRGLKKTIARSQGVGTTKLHSGK